MITLEAQGPVKETELFVDLLCSFGFVKTYSHTYKNIEYRFRDDKAICTEK